MASATKEKEGTYGSPEKARQEQIIHLLGAKHPESKELIDELSNLVATLMVEAENVAVERHGEQILQMIEGSRYQPEGCAAPSVDTSGDGERERFMPWSEL